MKQLLTLILVCSAIFLQAQNEKNFIVITDLAYDFDYNDKSDYISDIRFGENIHKLKYNLAVAKKKNNNFYYGLGCSFDYSSQELNPKKDMPELDIDSSTGYIEWYTTIINYTITNSKISPYFFVQYYSNISNKLVFATDFYAGYSYNLHKTKAIPFTIDDGKYYPNESSETITKQHQHHVFLGVQPSLRYSLKDNIGISLKFGNMGFNQKVSESTLDLDNKSKSFDFGFRPKDWQLGVFFML